MMLRINKPPQMNKKSYKTSIVEFLFNKWFFFCFNKKDKN